MDQINPQHYRNHPSGVETIEVTSQMGFVLGTAFKYLMRCGHKDAPLQDLQKSLWYIDYAIKHTRRSALREWWHANYNFNMDAVGPVEKVVGFESRYSGWMASAMRWVWAAHATGCVAPLVRAEEAVEKMIKLEQNRQTK